MGESRWQVKRVNWWNKPIPLMARHAKGFDQVGWVWNQTAYCVNNLSHGWIAFVDDQTPEKINMFVCEYCKSAMSVCKQFDLQKLLKQQSNPAENPAK